MKPKNARFWVFHRGHWVKLTLKPEQTVNHGYSYDNGEGWSWEASTYVYRANSGLIFHKWESGGSDCDGRHSTNGRRACHVEKLRWCPATDSQFQDKARDYFNGQLITRPDWQDVGKTRVYDQYAQMMNY